MVASPAKSIPINTKIALVDDNGDVLCWHGIPAVKRTSKTASHPDRVFWACSIYRGEEGHCKFFKWDDELPPHNNPARPSRQWHPPAQSSQSTQSSQAVAATPFSGPSSQPAPVSTSPTQSQPSSQTQPSSQPPPGQSQGYPTPSTPPRNNNKRPLPDTGSPSPSRIPKRTMPPPGAQARTPRHERLRAKIEAFLGPDGTSPPPAPAFGGPTGPTQPAETTYGVPYAAPGVTYDATGIPYDLAPPPPPSTYTASAALQPPHAATGFERRGGTYTQRSNVSAADAATVERLVSAMGADHSAREAAAVQRVRNARSVQTDPSSEFGDEVDVDADMESEGFAEAVAAEFFAAKGKEKEKAEEHEFFNPGSSAAGAGTSSVTSTAASSESIADMINGLGTIPAYVSKLEHQVAALQKGSDAKARRIKELLDENERLKKDKARMRAALRLAVADLDDDSATQGDESGPSGSAS